MAGHVLTRLPRGAGAATSHFALRRPFLFCPFSSSPSSFINNSPSPSSLPTLPRSTLRKDSHVANKNAVDGLAAAANGEPAYDRTALPPARPRRGEIRTIRVAETSDLLLEQVLKEQPRKEPPALASTPPALASTPPALASAPPLESETEPSPGGLGETYAPGYVKETTVESLSSQPFPPEVVAILQAPVTIDDVAAKPAGRGLPPVPYLPEIKYRRILNKAFGPGAWILLPVGPLRREGNVVSRDYQMFVFGRLVSEARGHQEFFPKGKNAETAIEGTKSNALMRCCKDLGIASELWDPDWVRVWQSRQPSAAGSNGPTVR